MPNDPASRVCVTWDKIVGLAWCEDPPGSAPSTSLIPSTGLIRRGIILLLLPVAILVQLHVLLIDLKGKFRVRVRVRVWVRARQVVKP